MSRSRSRLLSIHALSGLAILATSLPVPATAQPPMPPEMRREVREVMQLCRADYRRFCGDEHPGGGRILACLESHVDELNDFCRDAMPQAEALKTEAIQAGVLPQ